MMNPGGDGRRGPEATGTPIIPEGSSKAMKPPVPPHEPLLKPKEVAQLLKVQPQTVRRWADECVLPYVLTPYGHRRYVESAVREFAGRRPEAFACANCGGGPVDGHKSWCGTAPGKGYAPVLVADPAVTGRTEPRPVPVTGPCRIWIEPKAHPKTRALYFHAWCENHTPWMSWTFEKPPLHDGKIAELARQHSAVFTEPVFGTESQPEAAP